MFTFTKWIAAPAVALGLMFAGDASDAQAQYGCYGGYGAGYGGYGVGGIGISIGGGHLYRGGYRAPYYSGYRGHYGVGYRGSWYHDTSHLHYHPAQVYRHGDHFHVQPGHYDLHRTGHWHR